MNRGITVKGLVVTLALSGLPACGDPGAEGDEGIEGTEDGVDVGESADDLRLPGRHRHSWWWWWWRHHRRPNADGGTTADAGSDSGTAAVDSGTAEVDSGTAEVDSGTAEVDSGTAEVDSGTVEVDSGTVEVDSGTVEVDSGTVEVDSGTVEVDSGTVEVDSGTVEIDSGTVEVDSGTVEVDSGTVEVDSGTVEVDSGTGGGRSAACTACLNAQCTMYLGELTVLQDCSSDLCKQIVTCAEQAHLVTSTLDVTKPYCGDVSFDDCNVASYTPNGPCKALMEQGMDTTNKDTVLERYIDPSYEGGKANYLITCEADLCASQCLL